MYFLIMCLKCQKSWRKLVMFCRKAKNAEGKEGSAQFLIPPLRAKGDPISSSADRHFIYYLFSQDGRQGSDFISKHGCLMFNNRWHDGTFGPSTRQTL